MTPLVLWFIAIAAVLWPTYALHVRRKELRPLALQLLKLGGWLAPLSMGFRSRPRYDAKVYGAVGLTMLLAAPFVVIVGALQFLIADVGVPGAGAAVGIVLSLPFSYRLVKSVEDERNEDAERGAAR